MDPKLKAGLIALGSALMMGGAQWVTVTMPNMQRADSNRSNAFSARDQLRVCMQALSDCMEDDCGPDQ